MNLKGKTIYSSKVGGQPLAEDEKGCVSISFSLPYWQKAALNRVKRENKLKSRSSLISGIIVDWLKSQGINEQTEGRK